MARDARYNLSTEQRRTALAKSTTKTDKYLSDQLQIKLGTRRTSEILGVIGKTGEPYKKNLNDYLLTL